MSDRHSLRVYQAVTDARALLAEINCANTTRMYVLLRALLCFIFFLTDVFAEHFYRFLEAASRPVVLIVSLFTYSLLDKV